MLDYLAIAALADELREQLLGSRVQAVLQLDRQTLALELYRGARSYLVLDAHPDHVALALQQERARRGGGADTPLTLAARARLTGAKLIAIDQPPWERILRLTFRRHADVTLIFELMDRLANLVLVDGQDRILALARPVTSAMTRMRTLLAGQRYQPPPPPNKACPLEVDVDALAGWLTDGGDEPAWRVLSRRIRAVSPLLARELVARSLLESGTTTANEPPALKVPAEGVYRALAELFALPQSHAWEPGFGETPDGACRYAPYRLRHCSTWQPTHSLFEAIACCQTRSRHTDAYEAARQAVRRQLDSARRRVQQRLASLEREQPDLAAAEQAKRYGDLILAYQREIVAGQERLIVPDLGWPEICIELDPACSPVENARRYYERYRRARRAVERLPELIAQASAELATLDQLATDLELAENRTQIDAVQSALAAWAPGPGRPAKPRPARRSAPLRLVSGDGMVILVGRNSLENELVTFHLARRGDLWLHARDVPGGHVVVKSGGQPIRESTLERAAALAAYFSRARHESRVAVVVVDVRRVRRLPGAGPGMVRYDQARTLTVAPQAP